MCLGGITSLVTLPCKGCNPCKTGVTGVSVGGVEQVVNNVPVEVVCRLASSVINIVVIVNCVMYIAVVRFIAWHSIKIF